MIYRLRVPGHGPKTCVAKTMVPIVGSPSYYGPASPRRASFDNPPCVVWTTFKQSVSLSAGMNPKYALSNSFEGTFRSKEARATRSSEQGKIPNYQVQKPLDTQIPF